MSLLIKQLEAIRVANNWSTDAVSVLSGLHFNTVYNALSGRHASRISTVEAIANAMGYELVLVKKGSR